MIGRSEALKEAGKRGYLTRSQMRGEVSPAASSEKFNSRVFSRSVMEKMLPPHVFTNLHRAVEGKEKLDPSYADEIATAMKEWALSHGATHYCHWFQPLTKATAEKHDAFIDWQGADGVIEKFEGKQLIQGEPDASSFPSGGLRSTYEARGYTGWDPSSPVFLWNAGDGLTLFIPSVFYSWTGDVLDRKIPLLRSEKVIGDAAVRLMELLGADVEQVFSTLGWEQEYFVVDRALYNLRPDLLLAGRTVYGADPVKGQQLQDHYFGSVKDRILSYMQDFEDEALRLGIAVKTRHNEVAPAQHEVAPVFERSSLASDHNIMLMEVMRQTAVKHDLKCLLHEKPFAQVNGSGKHVNWSLSTDEGANLLDPGESPEENLQFLILLTAIMSAVHRHEALLRASVASASNDLRLGGHEAPPAIISVFLGDQLESILSDIEEKGGAAAVAKAKNYDLGIPFLPELPRDNTDRNRTSPFAFTGNKFEFRAPGSSQNCSEPVTILNIAVAQSLHEILDGIEEALQSHTSAPNAIAQAALPVLQKSLKTSRPIRFMGNNYSSQWEKEAQNRGLSNTKQAPHAYAALLSASTEEVFKGILQPHELESRYEVLQEMYCHHVHMEAQLMEELFHTHILPAAMGHQKNVADSLTAVEGVLGEGAGLDEQKAWLLELTTSIEEAILAVGKLKEALDSPMEEGALRAQFLADTVVALCGEARVRVDRLEELVDDALWSLPKYRELLFMV